jgi:aminoglycoside 6'-N-acetyltransferase
LLLALADGRPFGLIQRYPLAAYADYVEKLSSICPVPDGALSIDYLVGEPDLRGRGLGTAMIAALARESWVRHPDARDILVPVATGNRASWSALERAGFERYARGELEPDNPRDPPDHFVYRLRRPSG